jgi:hypothetical protein
MSTPVIAGKVRVVGRSPLRMAWDRIKQDRSAKIASGIIGFFLL